MEASIPKRIHSILNDQQQRAHSFKSRKYLFRHYFIRHLPIHYSEAQVFEVFAVYEKCKSINIHFFRKPTLLHRIENIKLR